jgi:ferredoxin--NADP+ reductase
VRSVAIVGSGPSGVFCAEALLRAAPDIRLDIIDRLPTPYGLVRSGVAPDHQSTKAVTRLFERVLAKPEVAFCGGVELERDVSLDELRKLYDAAVIATGATLDRRLGIAGEDLPGVYTSGRFVGWYNHHPDHDAIDLGRVSSAVVIGSGNVALDVARLLVKSEAEFTGSDLSPEVTGALAGSGVERVAVIGRSPAAAMKFTEAELLEFGDLERARPRLGAGHEGVATTATGANARDVRRGPVAALHAVDVRTDPVAASQLVDVRSKTVAALHAVVEKPHDGKPVEVVFEFGLTPLRFEGNGRLERVRFVDAEGTEYVREAALAVTCIGYAAHGHGLPLRNGALANEEGRIEDGLYVVGWAKRGPSGTIPTNRTEAQAVAKKIAAETSAGAKPGRAGLAALLAARGITPTGYAGWRRIDASEVARAHDSRTRVKWQSLSDLLAAAKGSAPD